MPKTREQRRALDAWEQVQTVKANPKLANDDYKSWARSFPTMVLMDGLPQALAFLAEQKLPLLGRLPDDRQVAECAARGGIPYRAVPAFGTALRNLLDRLLETMAP